MKEANKQTKDEFKFKFLTDWELEDDDKNATSPKYAPSKPTWPVCFKSFCGPDIISGHNLRRLLVRSLPRTNESRFTDDGRLLPKYATVLLGLNMPVLPEFKTPFQYAELFGLSSTVIISFWRYIKWSFLASVQAQIVFSCSGFISGSNEWIS